MSASSAAADDPTCAHHTGSATRTARVRSMRQVVLGTAIITGSVVAVVAATMSPGAGAAAPAAHHAPQHAPRHLTAAQTGSTPPSTPAPTPVAASAPATAKPVARTVVADTSGVSALAAGGIPQVALNAYRVAAARLAHTQPACGIAWYLLAGIGRVESDHGQFAGAVLHRDGLSSPAVIGPALNGRGNQYIPAPPNGRTLDGDAKYAHALGPMQFIPSTWAGWGADGNGDGKADIFNIDDAALGAARYLCAAGGNLRQPAGQSRAVLAYNHLTSYRNEVLALADAYRRGLTPTSALIGDITGSLPKTGHTGALPPATAGTPVATAGASAASRAPGGPTRAAPRPSSGSGHPTTPGHPASSCGSSSTSATAGPTHSSTPPADPSDSASSAPACTHAPCCPTTRPGP